MVIHQQTTGLPFKRKNEVSPTLPHSGKITHLIVHTFPLLEVPEITQCH